MKCALLISGYFRTFQSTISSLKKNILDDNTYVSVDIDIYVHITTDNNDKYLNSIDNNKIIEFINSQLKPKCLLIESNEHFSNNTNTNNLINNWSKYYKLNLIKKINENTLNFVYDIVIKYRPDLNLYNKFDFNIMNYDYKYIYIPFDSKIDINKLKNKSDPYLCDIFAFGSSKNMNNYFDLFRNILGYIKLYGNISETILYYHFVTNSILYKCIDIEYNVILSECNVFAIVGDSGSGKTTLGNKLKIFFNNSFILECDRYHKWERNNENWKNTTHLDPNANFICKMEKDIFNLKIGSDILQIDYDHSSGTFTSPEYIESKNNLIVCGLHCLYNTNHVYNIKIFMDTDINLKYLWKIKRDIKKRNYTINTIVNQIKLRENDYKKFILPQKENADIIIHFYTDSTIILNDISEKTLDENYNINLSIKICNKNKFNLIPIIEQFQQFHTTFKVITECNYIIFDFKEYTFNKNLFDHFQNFTYNMSNDFYDYIIYIILMLNI